MTAAKLLGRVKEVISGDTLNLYTENGVTTVILSGIRAPKLGKRIPKTNQSTPEEPFAWESREFLRKKLVNKEVTYTIDGPNANREYATVYYGGENINELMCKEGLAEAKSEKGDYFKATQEAKLEGKGKHCDPSKLQEHVRTIKWEVENLSEFVNKQERKKIRAVIERVQDGSTVDACLILPPEYVHVVVMISGIRCPSKKTDADGKEKNSMYADEAKKFTEDRLLQRSVEIILETTNSYMVVGTIYHPAGNIAEFLLKEGLANTVDWLLKTMTKPESDKLLQAEKLAQDQRLKIWKNWSPPKIDDKNFIATVVEIVNGDALMVKLPNGTVKKIFLAGIRPPQMPAGKDGTRPRPKKPLYDIPWMFEAREYLRKKLIGKKVVVTYNYTQPAKDNFPERVCCNVTISNANVAEALVSKGLAYVMNYHPDNDNRPSAINSLKTAAEKAQKGNKGVYGKKDTPVHRVNDICSDPAKAKNLIHHITRPTRIEALVEFVVTGSRLRLYLPKDSHLITFLLAGIEARYSSGDAVNNEEAATAFTRDKCMQRDVEIQVEGMDRNGNFIGWLWIDNVNMSVALVEAGLAKIHFTGENSKYSRELQNAKNTAIAKGLWKYVEKEETQDIIEDDKVSERQVDYKEIVVVDVTDLNFYCQFSSDGPKLNALQAKLGQEMAANPPLSGVYTPKRGDLCAAIYPDDNMWYRAKVERVSGSKVTVTYIDYGNKADISSVQCASLPSSFPEKPYAQLFSLAFVNLPKDVEDQKTASKEFQNDVLGRTLLLNVEYSEKGLTYVTLVDPDSKEDIGKSLVAEGYLLVATRREKRLQKIVAEYQDAESLAKKERLNLWVYGDVREDDDKEFGMGR